MENEGNSLLELPLETVEILEEVHIPSNHVVTVSERHEDNVGEILIDESARSGLSGMESNSIDFEFVNTDLGTGTDFNIDNTSVFGMTDNGMDVREDCEYLFRDSTCFGDSNTCVNKQIDVGSLTNSSMVSIPNSGKLNLYKDLGLKLQVIPLNNLQYVSTIQTSKGLHILAIPSQVSLPSNCDDITIQQLCQKSKPNSSEISVSQSLENRTHTISKSPLLKGENSESLTKIQAKNTMNEKLAEKGTLLSKSTRKLRNTMNKKLIICRNSTLKKDDVKNMCNRSNSINPRSYKKDSLGVMRSKNFRKQKMVSILNKSMTNRQKQTQGMDDRTTSKEIKVTFHLKPALSGENKKVADKISSKSSSEMFEQKSSEIPDEFLLAPDEHTENKKVVDYICTKSSSELFEPKPNETEADFEIEKQRTLQTGQDKDDLEMHPHKISDNEKVEPDRKASAKAVNILDETLESDQNQVRDNIEETSKEEAIVFGTREGKQLINEIPNKVLKTGTTSAENKLAGKGYQCKACLTTFSRHGNFKNHIKTHMDILTEPKDSVGPSTDSGEQFTEGNAVKKQPGGCSDCIVEKQVNQMSNVDCEMKPAISGKLFTCEFCEMSFKTAGNLTRHKLTHSANEDKKVKGRFQCDDCNRSFMQKCDLKRHIITHTGTYPYTCTVCQKGFIRQSDLNVHEKFHTQEKQYRCGLCSKSYFQSGDLSRHMRKSHSDVCQFTCQDCNKKYTTQKTLTIHMKTKH